MINTGTNVSIYLELHIKMILYLWIFGVFSTLYYLIFYKSFFNDRIMDSLIKTIYKIPSKQK